MRGEVGHGTCVLGVRGGARARFALNTSRFALNRECRPLFNFFCVDSVQIFKKFKFGCVLLQNLTGGSLHFLFM